MFTKKLYISNFFKDTIEIRYHCFCLLFLKGIQNKSFFTFFARNTKRNFIIIFTNILKRQT